MKAILYAWLLTIVDTMPLFAQDQPKDKIRSYCRRLTGFGQPSIVTHRNRKDGKAITPSVLLNCINSCKQPACK